MSNLFVIWRDYDGIRIDVCGDDSSAEKKITEILFKQTMNNNGEVFETVIRGNVVEYDIVTFAQSVKLRG